MNAFVKKFVCGIAALTMCLSVAPISASAATTYKKGDVNGDGTVNSADALWVQKFLSGKAGTNASIAERLDANRDYVIDNSDLTLIKNIVLGLASTSTITSTSSSDNVTQTTYAQYELVYHKFNASTGAEIGSSYTLSASSTISATSDTTNDISLMSGIIGDDDRQIDYSQSGVVVITNGTKILGTGFIVDSDKIVTAAHVLYDTEEDVPYSNIKYILYNSSGKKIDINGNVVSNQSSYMGISADSYHIPDMYIRASQYDDGDSSSLGNGSALAQGFYQDYALIKVNQDLSSYQSFDVGVFRDGIANTSQQIFVTGYNTSNQSVSDENGGNVELLGSIVTGSGYLCYAQGYGDKITNTNLYYNADVLNGESGGPIYI